MDELTDELMMITISSTDMLKFGKPYNNMTGFSNTYVNKLEKLKDLLENIFNQEDIDKIGKERLILILEREKNLSFS